MDNSVKHLCQTRSVLGESPVWSVKEQCLYFVDILQNQIHRYDPVDNSHKIIKVHENVGCIGLRKEGGFIAGMRTGIFLLNQAGEVEKKICENPTDPKFSRFNDGRVDPWGRFWCGTLWEPQDNDLGKLCRINLDLSMDIIEGGICISNGLAFSPDQNWMFHSDTPRQHLYRYPLNPKNGDVIGEGELYYEFESTENQLFGSPDGGACDSESHYWSAQFGGSKVIQLSENKEIVTDIHLPVPCPTMIAFGGEDLKTLFITSSRETLNSEELEKYPLSGDLFCTKSSVAGSPEPFFPL